jgi:hypothetical protein
MTDNTLARIVAQAQIQRLALIGISKNVGKTTTTNHLLETLLGENYYQPHELALTSLGLDGEATDALTGLPKPRYVPQAGFLVATTANFLQQAEQEGTQVERLVQLPGSTALGPVFLTRILQPGRIIIAGPTLLRDIRHALAQFQLHGTRLGIVDGAINRLGAASPDITDACIVCTGTSAGATPAIVARRTAEVLSRLATPQTKHIDVYRNVLSEVRLLHCSPNNDEPVRYTGQAEPVLEAQWIVERMHVSPSNQAGQDLVYLLRGAFTEELSRELLACLSQRTARFSSHYAEIVVGDSTRIFCHAVVLQRLADRGLTVRVARPIRILALTINPYTPEYACTPERLLETILEELPENHPPVLDVVSGVHGNCIG